MLDRTKLTTALAAAKNAAIAANERNGNKDIGGSCNFDTAYVVLPKGTRKATVEACGEAAGVRVSPHYTSAGRWFVHVPIAGQGTIQTIAAEAARTALKENGFDAHVYYATD